MTSPLAGVDRYVRAEPVNDDVDLFPPMRTPLMARRSRNSGKRGRCSATRCVRARRRARARLAAVRKAQRSTRLAERRRPDRRSGRHVGGAESRRTIPASGVTQSAARLRRGPRITALLARSGRIRQIRARSWRCRAAIRSHCDRTLGCTWLRRRSAYGYPSPRNSPHQAIFRRRAPLRSGRAICPNKA